MNTSGVVIPSEPSFIRTPFEYLKDESQNVNWLENKQSEVFSDETSALKLKRDIVSEEEMLKKLIDLIVYTPRGSFHPDPEFGFEFWNHEDEILYYNCSNNNKPETNLLDGKQLDVCRESIKKSLHTYAPQLKNVHVEIVLNNKTASGEITCPSKYCFSIEIQGKRSDGIKDDIPFIYPLSFFIRPTIKKRIV